MSGAEAYVVIFFDECDPQGTAIQCSRCGMTSWNKNDVERRYCGHCHLFYCEAAVRMERINMTKPEQTSAPKWQRARMRAYYPGGLLQPDEADVLVWVKCGPPGERNPVGSRGYETSWHEPMRWQGALKVRQDLIELLDEWSWADDPDAPLTLN